MKKIILALGLLISIHTSAMAEIRDPHPFEEWPALFLSYAYSLGWDYAFLDRLSTGSVPEGMHDFESPLVAKYQKLHALLQASEVGKNLERQLISLGHYCWVKWQPGMHCGDPAQRHFLDNGYLYVTDPIWPSGADGEPYLILIASGVSPRTTSIYRLFKDRVELLYGRIAEEGSPRCGLDGYDALFVTFGARVVDEGVLMLTETEGFHWDMLPRREYRLEVSADSCHLEKIEEKAWMDIPRPSDR